MKLLSLKEIQNADLDILKMWMPSVAVMESNMQWHTALCLSRSS